MRVILRDGPADGRILDLPEGMTTVRISVLVINDDYRFILGGSDSIYSPMQVAEYWFSGLATVSPSGEVGAVVYVFQELET